MEKRLENNGKRHIHYLPIMFESLFSQRGLSLDRLRGFLEMAEAGSIAKAAPGDPVRQSQISRQIRELEEFFGTELTRRRGKSLVLTPSGGRLARLVRDQLQGLDDFRSEAASRPKSFLIGSATSTLEWLVTPALPAIATTLGGARLRTASFRSHALVGAVREGTVDFAVVRRDAIEGASKKNVQPIVSPSFHLCVPRRLLGKGASAADLADPVIWRSLPFAAGSDGGQLDQAIRAAMEKAGAGFEPAFECGSMLQVCRLVARESCAAILPNLALSGLDPRRIFMMPFAPLAHYGRSLVLHWNPRQTAMRGVPETAIRGMAAALVKAGETSH